MTALRQRMIEDMVLRGLAKTTQRSYVYYVAKYASFFRRSPAALDLEAVRQFMVHLAEQERLSPESFNVCLSALKFVYLKTLEMPWREEDFPARQRVRPQVPTVLSQDEVLAFFEAITGVKNRMVVALCYGAGLRIAEAVALRITDIDGARGVLRVREGKGHLPRNAMLSPRLLAMLRSYYRTMRPRGEWLFPSWRPERHWSTGSVQQACRDAAQRAGITKRVTPHTLRHCFATHLLESGEDLHVIQVLLGHRRIASTAHYATVTPARLAKTKPPLDALLEPAPAPNQRGRPKKPTAAPGH